MNIQFYKDSEIFKIDTQNNSYLIGIVDEEKFLGCIYFGPYISDYDMSQYLRIEENPYIPSKNNRDRGAFLDTFPTEYSGNNVGDYRESSIEITDENGNEAIQLYYKEHKIYKGKPELDGLPATFGKEDECMTLEILLEDPVINAQVTLLYSIFKDSDAIARSVQVKNNSKNTLYLNKVMSLCLDMDDDDYELLTLHGSWARERHMEYREIGYGKQGVSSVKGESSHQEHPFIGLVDIKATQENGRVYGFHFVYSGNFMAQVEKNQFDSLRVVMGIHPKNFRFQLEEGESFVAPEVILNFSNEGLGGMTRTFHDLYRKHLIRSSYKDKKRPILINNWEATYFDFNTDKLINIAKAAKTVGIEMLVMDDGWFGNRNDDNTSLGDWTVNEYKLPGGLSYLVDEVNKIGLKFGIWFEPEMISPDSDLYNKHPDWVIAIEGRVPCRSRNQFVLDLSRQEVVDYVYECVANILRSANIEYVKWDMNRQLTDIGSAMLPKERKGELMHRYVLGVYQLQERLIREFPDLLLENCSGGGARFDPGMLYYSPQIWCSDDTDAIERLTIQEGTALLYPLSTIGAHVSDCPNHTVGRETPFETRGHVALAGTFGYELDITKISSEQLEMIPEQVDMYNQYNELIRTGDYYRIASYRENHSYDCYEIVAKDKSEALITYVQVLGRPNCHSRRICIPGLDAEKIYKIQGTDRIYHGDTLANAGILIENFWGDFRSRLIHICEISA